MFFFFNDTATTEIYTLSLHDALPICLGSQAVSPLPASWSVFAEIHQGAQGNRFCISSRTITPLMSVCVSDLRLAVTDRKSTRLNSSHANISYAVFCLKKKTTIYLQHL